MEYRVYHDGWMIVSGEGEFFWVASLANLSASQLSRCRAISCLYGLSPLG